MLHNIDKSKIHIISHTQQPFLDRKEAGELLVRELIYLKGKDVVVLGIPRGGLPVAQILAQQLEADIDIVL